MKGNRSIRQRAWWRGGQSVKVLPASVRPLRKGDLEECTTDLEVTSTNDKKYTSVWIELLQSILGSLVHRSRSLTGSPVSPLPGTLLCTEAVSANPPVATMVTVSPSPH